MLKQGSDLLRRIDDHAYSHVLLGVTASAIGGHIRHCLDFYNRFLRGLATGRIDYDARVRNELVERDRKTAITNIETVINQLQSAPITDDQLSVQVKAEGGQSRLDWGYSSISRELQFLMSHTVHHYALIVTMLRLQGYEPAADFGVAPSTLAHWRKKAA